MRNKLAEFQDSNVELLAIDPHESWTARSLLKDVGLSTDDLKFPLLMDPSLTVSATYGVAFQMRIHTEWSNRPATFVIDKAGVLRYAKRASRFNDRPSPAEILEQLKKLNQ